MIKQNRGTAAAVPLFFYDADEFLTAEHPSGKCIFLFGAFFCGGWLVFR